jgi:hypothetical protein
MAQGAIEACLPGDAPQPNGQRPVGHELRDGEIWRSFNRFSICADVSDFVDHGSALQQQGEGMVHRLSSSSAEISA